LLDWKEKLLLIGGCLLSVRGLPFLIPFTGKFAQRHRFT
jgi:hypothetical protein